MTIISENLRAVAEEYRNLTGYEIYGDLTYQISKHFKPEIWNDLGIERNEQQSCIVWSFDDGVKKIKFELSEIGYSVKMEDVE